MEAHAFSDMTIFTDYSADINSSDSNKTLWHVYVNFST